MFTLKQCRNKLCKMEHLLPTEIEKAYTEKLVNIIIMGVAVAVKILKEERWDDYPKEPKVTLPASGG